ncbi:MAG: thiamine pyrophosphate-binding protein [Desulfomonile tiedjei]|nr:thiamine pyrophosphate-binding protein [Desulfomonile tiedjei]
MATTTGGHIIASMLKEEGVEKIFGISDGTYLRLLKGAVDLGIELVTPRHETIAAHMAGAYARMTGKLGVCIASNGPGVANMLSGVAVENAEGNRVLLITSSRRFGITYPDRGGGYQCFDQVGVIGAMCKWSGHAATVARIPELLRKALRKCYEGRPGVVHLDVPESVINGATNPIPILKPHQYRRVGPIYPDPDQVAKAAEMLASAKLPIIHAGSGVIHAKAFGELERLATLLHSPVTTSWSARGVLPETSHLSWPMIHVKQVNQIRNRADLVLCLGSEVGETDWWGKAPYWAQPADQRWIQVDIDEEILGRTRQVDLAILADVGVFMRRLAERLQGAKDSLALDRRRSETAALRKEIDKDRMKLDEKLTDQSSPMVTAHVASVCRQVFNDDAVVIFDGGNAAVWGNFFYQVREPNTQMATHHFGHLGAGVGQALGAAVALPDRQVVCIIGDGAMGFNLQEIETAVRNNLKVIYLVCCDKQWGMVKMSMSFALKPIKTLLMKSLSPEETINTELGEIQFDKLAQAMGAHGERVSRPADLKPAIERCLAAGKCSVIHVDVDPTKHMWAPGLMHFKAMHQEPKGK